MKNQLERWFCLSNKEDDTPLNKNKLFGRPLVDFYSIYTIRRSLNRTVDLVTDRFGNTFACKTLNRNNRDDEDIRREVEVMYHLDGHPNIINLVNVIEDAKSSSHILMEHFRGGDLAEMIEKRRSYVKWPLKMKKPSFLEKVPFTENEAREVFRQMTIAISYCHEMGVMHRDIKPENFVFLTKKGGSQMKLIGFDFSTFFLPEQQFFGEKVGTVPYIAPEVINGVYGPKADIWSAGVILYTLLSGELPFTSETMEADLPKAISRTDYKLSFDIKPAFRKLSSNARQLIKRMLEENVNQRISAAEIMRHPWLRQADDGLVPNRTIITRMQKFQRMSLFTRIAVMVSAETLFEEETRGLRNMFESMKAIEENSEENLDIIEIWSALAKMGQWNWGISSETVSIQSQILDAVDVDGDQVISSAEFIAATVHKNRITRKDFLIEAFKKFDRQNTGYMSREDLQIVLDRYNVPERNKDRILKEVFTLLTQRSRSAYSDFEHEITMAYV